jgi:hypothetical protein
MFNDPNDGTIWRNGLYSIWLGYTTSAIRNIDEKVITNIEKRNSIAKTQLMYKNDQNNHNDQPENIIFLTNEDNENEKEIKMKTHRNGISETDNLIFKDDNLNNFGEIQIEMSNVDGVVDQNTKSNGDKGEQ